MLELAILAIAIIAIAALGWELREKDGNIQRQADIIMRMADNADGQRKLSKELLDFIDKNIHERVVYTTPELGYTSKIENKEEEEIGEDGEESYESTVENLMEINKDYHNEDKNNQAEGE